MLLEPRCTNSITSSRLNRTCMSLENILLSFLTQTKQDQGAPKSCPWEHLAPQRFLGFNSCILKVTFLGHPILKWQYFPAEALYLPPCPKALSLKHPPPDLPHPNYDKFIIFCLRKKEVINWFPFPNVNIVLNIWSNGAQWLADSSSQVRLNQPWPVDDNDLMVMVMRMTMVRIGMTWSNPHWDCRGRWE